MFTIPLFCLQSQISRFLSVFYQKTESKDSIKYKDKLIVIGINGKMKFAVKTNIKGLEQALGGGPRRITSLPDVHDNATIIFVSVQFPLHKQTILYHKN